MVTLELTFDRPTKRTVRFFNEDFGTIYVPNHVYKQLGEPKRLQVTLEPAQALQLAQAA